MKGAGQKCSGAISSLISGQGIRQPRAKTTRSLPPRLNLIGYRPKHGVVVGYTPIEKLLSIATSTAVEISDHQPHRSSALSL
jgi:hypothetical protein